MNAMTIFSRLWQRILQFFGFGKKAPPVPELEPAPAQVKKSRDERWLERHSAKKLISTGRGGPNMPKYQPCPLCHHRSKRLEKTLGGARYHCPNPDHGNFFVRR